jgi:hypothetical protein
MPVRYTFSGNLFRVNLEDTYTLDEMMNTFMDALNDPLFPENARFLLDVRQSSVLSERTYQDIRSVANFFAKQSDRVGGCCAIVADQKVHYGLSRMGATLAEIKGARVEVFKDISEAILWLGSCHDSQPSR